MKKEMCRTCTHFMQHYILDGEKLQWANCGHCKAAKRGRKSPYTKACEDYIYAEPVEAGYVNREYLSKKLLQRVLTMELLPEMNVQDTK